MPNLIRPPDNKDRSAFLRMLFLRTEQRLLAEIRRKRAQGYVDSVSYTHLTLPTNSLV